MSLIFDGAVPQDIVYIAHLFLWDWPVKEADRKLILMQVHAYECHLALPCDAGHATWVDEVNASDEGAAKA